MHLLPGHITTSRVTLNDIVGRAWLGSKGHTAQPRWGSGSRIGAHGPDPSSIGESSERHAFDLQLDGRDIRSGRHGVGVVAGFRGDIGRSILNDAGDAPWVARLVETASAASAAFGTWTRNTHSLRHSFVTATLDAGVPLRDVKEAASHSDPRTTMHYDRGRGSLHRHATNIVTTFAAGASR